MPFKHFAKGQKPTGGGKPAPIPAGFYLLRIATTEEKTASTGRDMVVVDFTVETQGAYFGKKIRYHNVVFIPAGEPGAGICLHFLKCIGLPYDADNLDVTPAEWKGRALYAVVGVNDRGYNVVNEVVAGPDASPESQEEGKKRIAELDQVPF
jgi:hypothetical protein